MNKRPVRFFNTTGPRNPDDHYMLPLEERLFWINDGDVTVLGC